MSARGSGILAQLRRRDLRIEIEGDRLCVNAPQGTVPPTLRSEIAAHKVDLVEALQRESEVLALSLADFAAQNQVIECSVPWVSETIWLVPQEGHADILVGRGVGRGRIWTAGELTDLAASGATRKEVGNIGRLKGAFGARILRGGNA